MAEIKAILNSVGPSSAHLQWDISLYVLFFLNLVVLLLLPDGQTMGTMLCIGVLISIFIDKTFAFGYILKPQGMTPEYCHAKIFVGTYLIRAAMFIAPATIAGSTDEGKVRAGAVVASIGGAIYSFARWYFDQRTVSTRKIMCFNPVETGMMVQSIGIVLILAKIVLRDRLLLGAVHRHIPVTVPGEFAAHEIEI